MSDLTGQWKKGELPEGEDYYIKWKDSEVFTATFVDFMGRKMFQRMELEFEELPIEHYLSVLAPVPSYEQWQAKLEENKRLKHDVGNLGYKIKNQRHEIDNRLKEIENLKELLKEVKDYLPEFETPMNILGKIDEALK